MGNLLSTTFRIFSRGRRTPVATVLATAIIVGSMLLSARISETLAADDKGVAVIPILYVEEIRETLPPLSLLDFRAKNAGIAGAQLGISDNNTTGRFLKQKFTLEQVKGAKGDDLIAKVVAKVKAGTGFIVLDASAEVVLALSEAIKDLPAVIFNAGAADQRLREADCRANVKHTAASHTMLTDALAQYLAWKQWRKVVLVSGPKPEDKRYAASLRRSLKRYGLKLLGEKEFEYKPGSRRADGGFEQVQKQIPSFTQDLPDHDVLLVADEANQFGEYFPNRTWKPRPVAGTHGLYPTTWHPASELWGATQFQNRFQRLAGRTMEPLDYAAWMAVRSIGESATRAGSGDPKTLIDYMLSDNFELAAFKGQKLTYRPWNAQIRQPIFVATPKIHVSVSPQQGFLHRVTVLDTLGIDKPETKCTAFK
ncbi:MAG: ABC transporter substrate-binding protein [Alphaproteobacteria bacterium]|nr:ABC transporter substrate-binding protein [Alphaproteobacteria bacterium]